MANEAGLTLKTDEPRDFIVPDGVSIEKGSILKISGARIAGSNSFVEGDRFAGIARREKIQGDGRTRLSLFKGGIFKVTASGVITAGDRVIMSGANLVSSVKNSVASAAMVAMGRDFATALSTFTITGTGEIEVDR